MYRYLLFNRGNLFCALTSLSVFVVVDGVELLHCGEDGFGHELFHVGRIAQGLGYGYIGSQGNRVEAFEFRYGGNWDVGPLAKIFAGPAFFETTFFRIGRHYLQNVVNALRVIFVIHTMVSNICKNSNKNQYGSNYFCKLDR